MRPVVGVIACSRMIDSSTDIHHVVFRAYTEFVQLGLQCVPVILPSMPHPQHDDDIFALVARLDGLLLTGSPSNVSLRKLGEAFAATSIRGATDLSRDTLSVALIQAAFKAKVPVLGICRGCQEINVAFGGDLYQAVHEVDGRLDHRAIPADDFRQKYQPRHGLEIAPSSWTESLIRGGSSNQRIIVNSLHSQAVRTLGRGLTIEAVAPDSTIEAIRHADHPFIYGVQWHLEWQASSIDAALAVAFRNSCEAFRASRERIDGRTQ